MKVNILHHIHKNNNCNDKIFSSSIDCNRRDNRCEEQQQQEVGHILGTDATSVTADTIQSRRRKFRIKETVQTDHHPSMDLGTNSKKMKIINHSQQQQQQQQAEAESKETSLNHETVNNIESPSEEKANSRNISSSSNSCLLLKGVLPLPNIMTIKDITTSITTSTSAVPRQSENIEHHIHHLRSHDKTHNTRNNNNIYTPDSHDDWEESKQTKKETHEDELASLAPQSCPFDLSPDSYLRKLFSSFLGYTPKTRVTSDLIGQLFPPIDEEAMVNYKPDIVTAVRENDLPALKTFHQDDGRSLSCCNRYGETLLHMACRRGYHSVVSYLVLEASVPIRVADDCGRNVLHDAFWNRNTQYEIVDLLIRLDPILLFSCDNRGYTPFSYARKEHWPVWRQFLWDRREHMKIALENDIELMNQLFQ